MNNRNKLIKLNARIEEEEIRLQKIDVAISGNPNLQGLHRRHLKLSGIIMGLKQALEILK